MAQKFHCKFCGLKVKKDKDGKIRKEKESDPSCPKCSPWI